MAAERPSLAEMQALLEIKDGQVVWLVSRGKARIGAVAGSTAKDGYRSIFFRRKHIPLHHVVWLLTHGRWPDGMLDHKNLNRADNAISNLRPATSAQNRQNTKAKGQTGLKGVVRHKCGRFQAQCGRTYLGLFASAEDAARAYDAEAHRRHGEFARLNFGSAAA